MTEKRLYELAHKELLRRWGRENDFMHEHPENKISIAREKKAWDELVNCETEMMEKGYK